ncbi:MAG TPA: phosphotriesterase-related protein [Mycobacteriales bacterium]|nr:phosphotriesterase-related protein [Mycobacteriales bacterium]
MTEIPTAGGTVDSGALGRTLCHEHVFVLTPDVQQNYPDEWDEERRVAEAIEKLTALKANGIDTIFDPTVVGLGRYIPRIVRIAAQVDLNIVVATGVYTYDEVPSFFRMRGPIFGLDLPEPMVPLFVRDLTEGIAGTGVRAAFLKCAVDARGMVEGVERVLRAVIGAHQQTGAPIMVHTDSRERRGLDVDAVIRETGVDPKHVMLAHCGDSADVDHLTELGERGYFLGMDRFGIDVYLPFEQRVETVAEMCRRGFAEQMLLAHDAACYIDWIDPAFAPMSPNWHYLHVTNDVLPALRERGVSDEQIETMMIDNPRRWITASA